jgi:putative CocE/NonD family hydrolase
MNKFVQVFLLLAFTTSTQAQHAKQDSVYFKNNYAKIEQMIPMRDGIKLYTAIYVPKDSSIKHPILFYRTPNGCTPYGKELINIWDRYQVQYCREKYILVYQDVRGRYMSEGSFIDVRPYNPSKKGIETDEASDAFDTIDWLVKHVAGNNGNVGVYGISYQGFYSTMAALSGHPALKAVSPQAPVTDWFIGDDFHHNGALMLIDAFSFFSDFGVPRPSQTRVNNPGYTITIPDKYQFFLRAGPLSNFNRKFLGDSIAFWNDLMSHPVYDRWWQSRNPRNFAMGIKPAMLVTGGLFDAEDLFGTWNLYKAIEANNPSAHFNKIVMGPWSHGEWDGAGTAESLGDIRFGTNASRWFQENVAFPFFQHFLNNKESKKSLAEATVFFSGENHWKEFNEWPPADKKDKPLYVLPDGKLSFVHPKTLGYRDRPEGALAYTEYLSDPAKPVPYDGPDTIKNRTAEYMTADQRFTEGRKDVISFQMTGLDEPLTLAGPIYADLMVSTSTTDADFVVKVIDVFPADISNAPNGADTVYHDNKKMNGYQMLVRADVMRGKFRNSFEDPQPFIPNKITRVRFELPDVAHTFLKGHRLMIQIQSSWFPLVDRNPQTFTDIYKATESDFKKATIRIFHTEGVTSKIILPVVEQF